MAKSNFEKVESVVSWVRDKKITGYRISKETNARENVYHCSSAGGVQK